MDVVLFFIKYFVINDNNTYYTIGDKIKKIEKRSSIGFESFNKITGCYNVEL